MNVLTELTEIFLRFPGVGKMQAKRFAYFLLSQDKLFYKNFFAVLKEIEENVSKCDDCGQFFIWKEKKLCDICANGKRADELLMVVERQTDMEAVEKSETYNGKYFILGKTIPIFEKSDSDKQNNDFLALVKRKNFKEIILALSATSEGENTTKILLEQLKPLKVKVSVLGRGLSTGTELEYSDPNTIKNALANRK